MAVSIDAVVLVGMAVSVGAGMLVDAWVGVAGSSVGSEAGISVAGDPQAVRSPMSRVKINNFVFIFFLKAI
jgi:hypothetical protein